MAVRVNWPGGVTEYKVASFWTIDSDRTLSLYKREGESRAKIAEYLSHAYNSVEVVGSE